MQTKKSRKPVKPVTVILYIFLIALAVIYVAPLLWMLSVSLKDNAGVMAAPFALPEVFHWENYQQAWTMGKLGTALVNSVLVCGITLVVSLFFGAMAAFAIARMRWKLSEAAHTFFLIGMMVPVHTVVVPVSYIIGALNLKNNIPALVMIYVAFSLPFSILVVTNFMKGVNRSLEEAALIDGATYFQIYKNVMLPMTVPAISTISIFNFLGAWNNILFPLLFINDKNLKPIALGLLNFNGERGSDYGPLMAAIVITVAVPLVIYLLFQEKVEGGLAAGAVKE